MSYSDFTLEKVKRNFDLVLAENLGIFFDTPPLEPSDILINTLSENLPLALASNTDKARSEMLIAPILIDLRKHFKRQISLFSGVDFSIDYAQGLNGICDFLISKSAELLIINTPVIVVVEAKKENITAGFGQCVAEMVAAQIFNQQQGNPITAVYGTVTTGSIWQFLKLEEKLVTIDLQEYYLRDIDKILGILARAIN
jgi:hypothetical protein